MEGPQEKQCLVIIVVIVTFTDFLEGGTVCILLDKKEALSEAITMFYASEFVLALEHLHRVGTQLRCSCPSERRNEAI
jgi:hypothetical protein